MAMLCGATRTPLLLAVAALTRARADCGSSPCVVLTACEPAHWCPETFNSTRSKSVLPCPIGKFGRAYTAEQSDTKGGYGTEAEACGM